MARENFSSELDSKRLLTPDVATVDSVGRTGDVPDIVGSTRAGVVETHKSPDAISRLDEKIRQLEEVAENHLLTPDLLVKAWGALRMEVNPREQEELRRLWESFLMGPEFSEILSAAKGIRKATIGNIPPIICPPLPKKLYDKNDRGREHNGSLATMSLVVHRSPEKLDFTLDDSVPHRGNKGCMQDDLLNKIWRPAVTVYAADCLEGSTKRVYEKDTVNGAESQTDMQRRLGQEIFGESKYMGVGVNMALVLALLWLSTGGKMTALSSGLIMRTNDFSTVQGAPLVITRTSPQQDGDLGRLYLFHTVNFHMLASSVEGIGSSYRIPLQQ
ncbi:hypothetical protein HZA38_02530 [Candidatus Peregrinibacteria bacterium]|nr:hypothetical protein [Candidatus Peregrinibacteria bacterium]